MSELDDMADGSGALCVMIGNDRDGARGTEAEVDAAGCAEG